MGRGAQPDCRADRGVDARRRRSELALIEAASSALIKSHVGTAARAALLVAVLVASSSGAPAVGAPETPLPTYDWHLPRGFPVPAVPADNPMSDAKVALGRRLFFESRLSVTGQYSCASCHEPARAFTDGRALARGATGGATQNNAMTLTNVAYNVSFGWAKPQVRSLEAQMLEPLLNEHPVEMGMKGREAQVSAALSADTSYREAFAAAFPESGGAATLDRLVKAIAAFERSLISGRSRFDAYVFGGAHGALSEGEKRGMALFYSARLGCSACHSGFNFAGNWRDVTGDTGEPSFATNGTSATPLRVPTLRNVAMTAPYMHDGRFSTLEAVVAHYESAGRSAGVPAKSGQPTLHAFTLSAGERADLLAFLESLTDPEFVAGYEEQHPVPGR